jgi:hypothetical protein
MIYRIVSINTPYAGADGMLLHMANGFQQT